MVWERECAIDVRKAYSYPRTCPVVGIAEYAGRRSMKVGVEMGERVEKTHSGNYGIRNNLEELTEI